MGGDNTREPKEWDTRDNTREPKERDSDNTRGPKDGERDGRPKRTDSSSEEVESADRRFRRMLRRRGPICDDGEAPTSCTCKDETVVEEAQMCGRRNRPTSLDACEGTSRFVHARVLDRHCHG